MSSTADESWCSSFPTSRDTLPQGKNRFQCGSTFRCVSSGRNCETPPSRDPKLRKLKIHLEQELYSPVTALPTH